ncbi:MAG: DegT/DnrJ/EryC1/StrS family aminotransferase, partial [Candidatus Auribacterota bacterium]|nr:DegT/DnrJ/EryC1/StrS family aminotransferase [Candidatus Auribacterota bacterium]
PIFADIDPETWCISPESFKEYITPGTKAIIPVDLYGGMPDMDSLKEIALRHKIAIIEDAAEAIGSKYKGRRAGSFGDTGVFSFHGSKTLTTGEGGMLVTDREDLYRRVLFLRDHGRAPGSKLFYNSQVAYKYKMSSLQAALGLAQLERVDELVEKKRLIFSWYRRELEDIKDITLNPEPPGTVNSCWMVTIVVDEELGLTKERLMAELEKKDIDSRPFFYPLSSLPAYDEVSSVIRSRRDNKDAYRLSPYGINLPSALNLTESQVEYVAEALRSILSRSY